MCEKYSLNMYTFQGELEYSLYSNGSNRTRLFNFLFHFVNIEGLYEGLRKVPYQEESFLADPTKKR